MTKIAQRPLLEQLKYLIDHASAKSASAARDVAKSNLRAAMRDGDWNTVFILYNLGVRRNRYLRSIGYPVPSKYLYARESDVERINAYHEKEH
jgi:hypothetical protein